MFIQLNISIHQYSLVKYYLIKTMVRIITVALLLMPIISIGQTQNFWTKKNDFGGLKRERAVGFSIGTMGFISCGVDTAEVVLKDLWQYNAVFDSWTQKANLPGSKRRDAVAFVIGSKGYVGSGIDNDESAFGVKLKDFWEYDPATNLWSQIADYPGSGGLGIYFATAFTIDTKAYVCGGKFGPNSYSNQLWEYKPSINQWTQRANFTGGVRYQLSSFSVGYYGYVGLGANQDVFKKDFWKYNGGTNQWTQIADLPASERGGATTFTIGSRGFVCMGNDGGILDDLWEYNPSNNQWYVRAPYGGSERKNAVAFVIDGKAYVGTGKGFSGKKSGMEEYTPYEVLGYNELTESEFSVYPNPSNDIFYIDAQLQSIESFTIFSADGRVMMKIKNNTVGIQAIDRTAINPGVYMLSAMDRNGSILNTKQIILL